MARLVWWVAALGLLGWTLLAWLGHALLGWGAGLVSGGAIALPLEAEAAAWLSWLALLLGQASGAIVIAIWALGAGVILILAAVARRILARKTEPRQPLKPRFPLRPGVR